MFVTTTHGVAKSSSTNSTESSSTKNEDQHHHLDDNDNHNHNHHDGRSAHLTLLGSFLVFYASFGLMSSFGFFQDFYAREFLVHTPESRIAFIGTLQMALTNLMAAVSGALCDRYGVKVRLTHPFTIPTLYNTHTALHNITLPHLLLSSAQ